MKKCSFCEDIEWWKEHKSNEDKFKTKFFVHIGIYNWYKEQKAIRGKQKSKLTVGAYKINYCPTCGKNIKVGE